MRRVGLLVKNRHKSLSFRQHSSRLVPGRCSRRTGRLRCVRICRFLLRCSSPNVIPRQEPAPMVVDSDNPCGLTDTGLMIRLTAMSPPRDESATAPSIVTCSGIRTKPSAGVRVHLAGNRLQGIARQRGSGLSYTVSMVLLDCNCPTDIQPTWLLFAPSPIALVGTV